ncbi:MAG TPA: efflux RND transporter permease subunit [Pseudomonadales bacterium]
MHFTDVFIRRPVLAMVVSLTLLLIGLKAFDILQVRQYPEITNDVVSVTTIYPGADAELVKGFITTPLQHVIATAEGIEYITAVSDEGKSTILAYVDPEHDVNIVMQEVIGKVNKMRGELPRDAEDPIVEKQINVGSDILQYIGFYSDQMSEEQITDYLSKAVEPILSTLPGVGRAEIRGKKTFAMRIWLDSDRMAAFNVSADDVSKALQKNNFQSAAGQVRGDYVLFNVSASTSLESAEGFENIVIRSHDGALVRVRDVARVELGSENYDSRIRFNGETAIFIKISAAAGANPLEVAANVREALPRIQRQLPPSLNQDIVFDTTIAIERSIHEVAKTIVEASLIVIIVIYFFLGSFRSVIIPVVTIPLSLVGVLMVMLMLGFSVNLLTLLAMVLAIGLVVDDAIVVVENIQRHIEEGDDPFSAAIKGAREIAFPVIVMTLTLAAVYGPIGFVEGVTGKLFTEFAFTLAGAVIVSGVVALTLSPMMCARLLQSHAGASGWFSKVDAFLDRLKLRYRSSLRAALNNRTPWLLLVFTVIGSLYFLYREIPRELAPTEDYGVIFVTGTGPLSTNIDFTSAYNDQIGGIYSSLPEHGKSFIMSGYNGPNTFLSLVILKDWSERIRSQKQVQQDLQAKLGGVAGLRITSFNLPGIPGATSGLPLQFALMSTASDEMVYQVAQTMLKEMLASGLFIYAATDLEFDKPRLQLMIDREKAAEMGISMESIGHALSFFLGEGQLGRFAYSSYSYKVIPQLEQPLRDNPQVLERYQVPTSSGAMAPLSAVVSWQVVSAPNKLSQFQQLNATYIGGLPAPGVTMGEIISFMEAKSQELLPQDFSHDYMGESRQFIKEGGALTMTFVFSFVLIYLVLAAQFESFIDPVVVLISVPMSICGALIPMALGVATLNIYTQIGLVTLIGLISKHGILIVDFANRLREQGLDAKAAVEQAAAIRLRPILMTTAAMVFGVLPLMLASGPGAVSRQGIGWVIASGMAIGTLFTLYVVPVVYSYLAARDRRAGSL